MSFSDIRVWRIWPAVHRQHVAVRHHPQATAVSCPHRLHLRSHSGHVPGTRPSKIVLSTRLTFTFHQTWCWFKTICCWKLERISGNFVENKFHLGFKDLKEMWKWKCLQNIAILMLCYVQLTICRLFVDVDLMYVQADTKSARLKAGNAVTVTVTDTKMSLVKRAAHGARRVVTFCFQHLETWCKIFAPIFHHTSYPSLSW